MAHVGGHARRWGVCAALGIASLFLVAAQPWPAQPPNTAGAQSGISQAPAPPPPSSNQPPCGPSGHPDAAQPECREAVAAEETANYTHSLIIVGLLSVIGLVGQIVALVVTIRQTRIAAQAAVDSVKASQRSAKAAEDSVSKSDELLTHSKAALTAQLDSAHRMERAYAFISPARDDGIVFSPYGYRIIAAIGNYGKTPAFVKAISLRVYHNKRPSDDSGHVAGGDSPGDYIWSAGEVTSMPQLAIYHSEHSCWIGMQVHYDDIFGKSHYSRFLMVVSGSPAGQEADFVLAEPFWNAWT